MQTPAIVRSFSKIAIFWGACNNKEHSDSKRNGAKSSVSKIVSHLS